MNYLVMAIEWIVNEIEVLPADGDTPAKYRKEKHSYKESNKVVKEWKLKGRYKRVLSDNPPIYLKDGKEYAIHCFDSGRIDEADLSAWTPPEKQKIKDKGLEVECAYVENRKGWLADQGYVRATEETE